VTSHEFCASGQAKAQRAKGFERIDVTFDERDSKDAQA
jgi:hypothetical protein